MTTARVYQSSAELDHMPRCASNLAEANLHGLLWRQFLLLLSSFLRGQSTFMPHSSKPTRVRADETANMVSARRYLRTTVEETLSLPFLVPMGADVSFLKYARGIGDLGKY